MRTKAMGMEKVGEDLEREIEVASWEIGNGGVDWTNSGGVAVEGDGIERGVAGKGGERKLGVRRSRGGGNSGEVAGTGRGTRGAGDGGGGRLKDGDRQLVTGSSLEGSWRRGIRWRVEEFDGEGSGGDARARRQRREAEEGGDGGSAEEGGGSGGSRAAAAAVVAAAARRRVVAATAVGLLPRPSVSSHSRRRRLISFLK